jgi:hypothetical protein
MRTTIAAAGLLAGLLSGMSARATGTDDEARIHFQQGIELYKQGDYEQAAVEFKRAYELKPSYKILFNVGQVENELKHYALALDAYVRYLAQGGGEVPAERTVQVREEIKRLNTLVGMLTIKCDAAGASVFVDGRKKGEIPLPGPVFVDLGEREVLVKKGGSELHREIVTVAGGQSVEVVVETGEAAVVASAPEEATGSARPAAATEPGPAPEADAVTPPDRIWMWVAFGVGGAAAIGAAVTGGLAISSKNDLDGACPDNGCPASKLDDLDTARTLGNAATALTVIAAAGVAAGVVLWFVEPGLASEGGASVALVPGGASLAVAGRF